MAMEWYLTLGGTEIANSARLETYLDTVGSPLASASVCGCPTLTGPLVGDRPYTTPAEDNAPWFDPDTPESAQFAGLMVLSVDGLDDHPEERQVTGAVTGGAALGAARVRPRTITITGVLLGSTCCGVAYGLRWLGRALSGCTGRRCGRRCGGGRCGGANLTLYNCCPTAEQAEDPEGFRAWHRRTVRRVALTDGPRVIDRAGGGCGGNGGGECQLDVDMPTVELVLTAATPWQWTDPIPILEDIPVPTDDGTECITWCIHTDNPGPEPVCLELSEDDCPEGAVQAEETDGECSGLGWPVHEDGGPCEGTCRLAACPADEAPCEDPACRTPTPPVPPPPETCFCHALGVNSELFEVDLDAWPEWFGAVPIITVHAGSHALRRLTITFFAHPEESGSGMACADLVEQDRCHPHSVYEIGYVPPGGTLTLDGQVGRAVVECEGACETSSDVYGRGGSPLAFELLEHGQYCVLIEADAISTPAEDATISIALSGREY